MNDGNQKTSRLPHIRVGLFVNEFFDSTLKKGYDGFGGYGMLARHYIAEYVPDQEFSVVTILGFNDRPQCETAVVDGRKTVMYLPWRRTWPTMKGVGKPMAVMARLLHRRALRECLRQFDVFLGIETMPSMAELFRCIPRKKLIIYIQDPRPDSEWKELDSTIGTDDGSPRPNPAVRAFYRQLVQQDRLIAISQGQDLITKARDLYHMPDALPVRLVRNPVTIDEDFDLAGQVKEDGVLYLGRLDPVKRPWLALEVAKRMPNVQFYFLGKAHGDMVPYIIYPYHELPNVHLMGHQSGDVKTQLLKKCKVLINTSIHEAIPVSFLEAMAYGTLIVSCQNPDSITEKFGVFTGKVLGDGRDQADAFVQAIQHILSDETGRRKRAEQAIAYVRQEHNLSRWVELMRETIRGAVVAGA